MPPPAMVARLPERVLLLSISVPELTIPPPVSALPFWMVRPEIATVKPLPISNTLDELFPLIVRLEAPGPLIVRFLLIKSSPLVSVMVAGRVRLKLMVSPGAAAAIASRSDPGPLSAWFVTVIAAAKAGTAPKTASITVRTRRRLAKGEAKIAINLRALGFITHLYLQPAPLI